MERRLICLRCFLHFTVCWLWRWLVILAVDARLRPADLLQLRRRYFGVLRGRERASDGRCGRDSLISCFKGEWVLVQGQPGALQRVQSILL